MPFTYDESDPSVFVVYIHHDHDNADYRHAFARWAERLQEENQERFAIVLDHEDHHHDHDHHHERDEEREAEFVKMINDFRRDYRALSNAKTIAFVNIYNPKADWLVDMLADDDTAWEKIQAAAERSARYMFGTRGRNFTNLADAKTWIAEQATLPPLPLNDDPTPIKSQKIGLYFGSSTGVTEDIAYRIGETWQSANLGEIPSVNVGTAKTLSELLNYDYLILGVPTWNIGQLQDDWDIAFPELEELDFTGKSVALFGIGDQEGYPDNFQDALGILGNGLRKRGATLVGFTSVDGYEFAESVGVENGHFMGLAIDELNQSDLTDDRIKNWVKQLTHEFELVSV